MKLNRIRARAVVLFATLALAAAGSRFVRAAEAPAKGDDAILPFIDEGTFVVGRLDIDRIDKDALAANMEQFAETVLKTTPIPENGKAEVKKEGSKAAEKMKLWLTGMGEAGARRVYILGGTSDMSVGAGNPIVIVPMDKGMDAERVQAMLSAGANDPNRVQQLGDAVVLAELKQFDRLKARFEPGAAKSERPDLAKAFASTGDAAVRLALVPSDSVRATVEQKLTKLPEMFGGGEGTVLTQGLRWASIAIKQKPEARAVVTFQAVDAGKAKALNEIIVKGIAGAKQGAAAGANAEETGKIFDAIQPRLAGDAITLDVDPMLIMNGLRFVVMESRGLRPPPPAGAKPTDDGGL